MKVHTETKEGERHAEHPREVVLTMGIYVRQDPIDRRIQEQTLAALQEQNRLLGGILHAVDYLARAEDHRLAEAEKQ